MKRPPARRLAQSENTGNTFRPNHQNASARGAGLRRTVPTTGPERSGWSIGPPQQRLRGVTAGAGPDDVLVTRRTRRARPTRTFTVRSRTGPKTKFGSASIRRVCVVRLGLGVTHRQLDGRPCGKNPRGSSSAAFSPGSASAARLRPTPDPTGPTPAVPLRPSRPVRGISFLEGRVRQAGLSAQRGAAWTTGWLSYHPRPGDQVGWLWGARRLRSGHVSRLPAGTAPNGRPVPELTIHWRIGRSKSVVRCVAVGARSTWQSQSQSRSWTHADGRQCVRERMNRTSRRLPTRLNDDGATWKACWTSL